MSQKNGYMFETKERLIRDQGDTNQDFRGF